MPKAETATRCGTTPTPAAAITPPAAAPASAPNEKKACSEDSTGRRSPRSTVIPCTFIATSRTPLASPTTRNDPASARNDSESATGTSPTA